MFIKKAKKTVVDIYFFSLAVLMYYFLYYDEITVGGVINVPVRQFVCVAIVLSGIVYFLACPDVGRISMLIKSSVVLCLPLFVIAVASLPVWFAEKAEFTAIYEGTYTYGVYTNQALAVMVAAVLLYVFGEKGIWYNLLALLIVNIGMIAAVIADNGLAPFIDEFLTLIVSFAGETGDIVKQVEYHELAFCLGIYLVYMMLYFRKKPWFIALFILAVFCFIAAFKRIAIFSMFITLFLGFILRLAGKGGNYARVRSLATFILLVAVVVLFLYIPLINLGLFDWLEKIGVDTKERNEAYRYVSDLYEFSPFFIGHGAGSVAYELINSELFLTAVHNDFLQFYIDLGFWGYLFWLLSMTVARSLYFGSAVKGMLGMECCIVATVTILFIIIVSSTDNTMNFQLTYTIIAIIVMGHGFQNRADAEEKVVFAHAQQEI